MRLGESLCGPLLTTSEYENTSFGGCTRSLAGLSFGANKGKSAVGRAARAPRFDLPDKGKPAARRGREYQGPLAKERQPGCRKECLRCTGWLLSRRQYRSALAWQPYVPHWLGARITNRTQRSCEHGMSGRYEEA